MCIFAIFRHHDQVQRKSNEDWRIRMMMMFLSSPGRKLRRRLRNEKMRVMRKILNLWQVAKLFHPLFEFPVGIFYVLNTHI